MPKWKQWFIQTITVVFVAIGFIGCAHQLHTFQTGVFCR